MATRHKCSKKLRKLPTNSPYQKSEKWGRANVYEDFIGDIRNGPFEWCEECQRWIPPSYFKGKKPVYIHTCYDAGALKVAESDTLCPPMQIKLPKHWGEMRFVKLRNRIVKLRKDGFWIRQWRRWIKDERKIKL